MFFSSINNTDILLDVYMHESAMTTRVMDGRVVRSIQRP